MDYRAFYFRIVQDEFKSGRSLLVKHGGGQERISLGFYTHAVAGFEQLTSDARYHMMHLLYRVHEDAVRMATDQTVMRYNTAFAEGRLKKRKVTGQNMVKVWIEG